MSLEEKVEHFVRIEVPERRLTITYPRMSDTRRLSWGIGLTAVTFLAAMVLSSGYLPWAEESLWGGRAKVWALLASGWWLLLAWGTGNLMALWVPTARREGMHLVRRNLAAVSATAKSRLFELVIDGEPMGVLEDPADLEVGVARRLLLEVPGRGRRLAVFEHGVVLRWRTTVYEVARPREEALALTIAEGLARLFPERPDVRRYHLGGAVWQVEAMPSLPSCLFLATLPLLWNSVSGSLSATQIWGVRVGLVATVFLARASVGALRLSACAAANPRAFTKVFPRARPLRPTPWLTPGRARAFYLAIHAGFLVAAAVIYFF